MEERGERGSSALPQPGEIKGIDFMGLCGTHWDPEQSKKKQKLFGDHSRQNLCGKGEFCYFGSLAISKLQTENQTLF